jgi:hypothetical protein
MEQVIAKQQVPDAAREELQQLRQRYDALDAMLPSDVDELTSLDAADLDATLANIELISAEMLRISGEEIAILEELLVAAPAVETELELAADANP